MQNVSWIVPLLRASVLALMVMWPVASAFAAAPTFAVPAGERQLFLDDVGIAEIENLTRTMHSPAKKGAVIRSDPAKAGALQIRSAPLWIPEAKAFRFLVGDTLGPRTIFRWFTSTDGLHWTPGDPLKMPTEALVYDAQEPDPSRRYKAANPAGFIVSADGINWKKLDVPPIPSSDEHNFALDPKAGLYLMTVKIGGPHGRSVGLATSRDFKTWTNHGLVFHADDLDQEIGRKNIEARLANLNMAPIAGKADPARYNVDVYNMGLFRYESLYIGTPAMYHAVAPDRLGTNTNGFHIVELTCSRDLKSFRRVGDRKPFIAPSPMGGGAYDLTQIIGPSDAIVRGDEVWFYYTSLKFRGGSELANAHEFRLDLKYYGAISLAVLRRDGFISLDAGETEGTIQTEPFKLPGSKLFVNVDGPAGELRVEVLGENRAILATSVPMKGDLLHGEVKWQKGNIADLEGKAVSLRFTFRNASLYSYWLQ